MKHKTDEEIFKYSAELDEAVQKWIDKHSVTMVPEDEHDNILGDGLKELTEAVANLKAEVSQIRNEFMILNSTMSKFVEHVTRDKTKRPEVIVDRIDPY